MNEFTNDPKQKNKLEFFQKIKSQNATGNLEDIQISIETLVRSSADKKLRRVYGAFVPVVEALKDYTGVIDTMSMTIPVFHRFFPQRSVQHSGCLNDSKGCHSLICLNRS